MFDGNDMTELVSLNLWDILYVVIIVYVFQFNHVSEFKPGNSGNSEKTIIAVQYSSRNLNGIIITWSISCRPV